MRKARNIFLSTIGLFSILAPVVHAQRYYYEYQATPEQAGAIFAGLGAIWLVLCLCGFVVGLAIYIFTSLQYAKIYEKNGMADKKVLAFIPIVQNYYLAKAVGEDEYAWVQIAIPVGMLISIPLCFVLIGFCLIFPLAIAAIIFSVKLWMLAAERMGKDQIWGLAASLGSFIPVVGYFIQLYAIYVIAEGSVKKSS